MTTSPQVSPASRALADFCSFLDRWINSLPDRGKQQIKVRGKIHLVEDLNKPPFFGALFQAYLEGQFAQLIKDWAT